MKNKIEKISKLASENWEYKKYLRHLESSNNELESHLEKINSAKIFNAWESFFLYYEKAKRLIKYRQFKKELSTKKEKQITNILIFGGIKYDFRFQRPQQLANELAKRGNQIFYIDPDFLYLKNKNDKLVPEIIKVKENLYKIKLATHNKYTKRKFIYYGEISSEDNQMLTGQLKSSIINNLNNKIVIKSDNPFWEAIIKKINAFVIYDCMDDHGAVDANPKSIVLAEENTVRKSNVVITVSKSLAKKLKTKYKRNIMTIKNAGEFYPFISHSLFTVSTPLDIKKLNKPIIGYCGAISEWFDTSILENIAKNFPNCSIVLIGSPDNSLVRKLSEKYKNIHLLGEKRYELLPYYYKEFDVCMIPFSKKHKIMKTLNPVKVYEYLATGKPVVTSFLPELINLKNLIYMSKKSEDFCKNISIALKEKDKILFQKRIESAKENTWKNRAEELDNIINKIFNKNL